MLRSKPEKYLLSFILLILSCLVLTGCGAVGVQTTPIPTTLDSGENLIHSCPEEDTLYSLWFSHLAVLDIDPGNGETFHLEFENVPPSYFDLWIYADGTISNEGIFREAPIGYQGTANHPDSNDCPVQTFAGEWQMRAKISGTCANDIARVHIIEEWINPVLESNCVSGISPGTGVFSAPELDLVFNLKDQYPADGLSTPEGSTFQASYYYHLWPAGYELPIVPLVPEEK